MHELGHGIRVADDHHRFSSLIAEQRLDERLDGSPWIFDRLETPSMREWLRGLTRSPRIARIDSRHSSITQHALERVRSLSPDGTERRIVWHTQVLLRMAHDDHRGDRRRFSCDDGTPDERARPQRTNRPPRKPRANFFERR